jgi:transcriptional regulator with XRE-family HTH domain
MSLFFDAAWFDAKLASRGLAREALAQAAALGAADLEAVFTNLRSPTAQELNAFAQALGADLVEVTLRSGVVARGAPPPADSTSARIESIEARLDAMDAWLAEFEATSQQRRA